MGPLIFQGNDVRLVRRTGTRGQVTVEFLARNLPTGRFATAWPHEIRNHRDGIAGIRKAIADLPADVPTGDDDEASLPHQDPRPRAFLHAHHAAGNDDRED